MSTPTNLGVRQSVHDLQNEYNQGNKKPLEDLVRAWKGIKELPPTDKRSFFVLGGITANHSNTGETLTLCRCSTVMPIGVGIATMETSCSRPGTGYMSLR